MRLVVALALLVASCTFPSVTYDDDASVTDATTDVAIDSNIADTGTGNDADDAGDAAVEADPCDRDHDGYRAKSCDGGTDCDDNDPRANPGVIAYVTDIPDGASAGDWNCDGTVMLQYGVIPALCTTSCGAQGFVVAQGCGITAPFETCAGTGVCFVADAGSKTQGCL